MAKVLIIEDSRFQRRNLQTLVEDHGHEVDAAENGKIGIEKIQSGKPDLVITDLVMPETDGFTVLEFIQGQAEKVPAIVLTADIQGTVKMRCLRLGAQCFLNKPVNPEELIDAMDQALC